MFSTYYIIFILFYIIACSIEFIVFNEEILLAICFFSFVFFAYNSFSDSLFSSLMARASKFESDFLLSFSVKKKFTVLNFNSYYLTGNLQSKFQIMLISFISFLTLSKQNLLINQTTAIYNASFAKFSELLLINTKIIATFHKNCVDNLLYPLVFKATKKTVLLSEVNFVSVNLNTKSLKHLSVN